MSESAGAKQQDKRQPGIKPVREWVERRQRVPIRRSAITDESVENRAGAGSVVQGRAAVRRTPGDSVSGTPAPAKAFTESRFAHDFSQVRTHTAPPQIRPVITTRMPPSTVAGDWRPDTPLTDTVAISYDPETNQVRMRGRGAADYLREHAAQAGAGAPPAAAGASGYLTVDVGSLDEAAQGAIATALGVDRRVLLGRRRYRRLGEAPDNLDSPLLVNGEWDGERILNSLTQVDRDPNTLFDESRCGPSSALAIHIMSGFQAVANVVAGIRDRVNNIRIGADRRNDEELARATRAMLPAIDIFVSGAQERARYRHLDLVSDALFLVVNEESVLEMRAGGEAVGTTVGDMSRLSEAGHARADPTWANRWAQLTGSGRFHGRTAISGLPPVGERFGMGDLAQVVRRLREFRLMSLIVAVPATAQEPVSAGGGGEQYIEEGALSHYITLGVNADGRVFVYDPYPRALSQLLWVDGNQAALESYFLGRWRIEGRMAAATTSARGPDIPRAPDSHNRGALARYWALGVFQGLGILEIGDGQIRINRAVATESYGATPASLNSAYYHEYTRMLAQYNTIYRSGEGSTPVVALQPGSDAVRLVDAGDVPDPWRVRSSVLSLVRTAQQAGWPRTVSAARGG